MCEAELLLRHNQFKQVCELEVQRLQHQVMSLQQQVQSLQERLTTPSSQAPSRSSSVASVLSTNINASDPFGDPLPKIGFAHVGTYMEENDDKIHSECYAQTSEPYVQLNKLRA